MYVHTPLTANSLRQKKFSLSIVEGDPVVSVAHCKLYMYMYVTILNLILHIEKKNNFNFEKRAFFGKGRQSLHR